MTEPERGEAGRLGRKPKWLVRWESRAQQKFDRQSQRAMASQLRHAAVQSPDGTRYLLRTVVNGRPLRELGAAGDTSGLEFAVVMAEIAVSALLTRLRKGWMVGVVREGTAWRGQKVLFKEVILDEATIEERVRKLTESIRNGAFPP